MLLGSRLYPPGKRGGKKSFIPDHLPLYFIAIYRANCFSSIGTPRVPGRIHPTEYCAVGLFQSAPPVTPLIRPSCTRHVQELNLQPQKRPLGFLAAGNQSGLGQTRAKRGGGPPAPPKAPLRVMPGSRSPSVAARSAAKTRLDWETFTGSAAPRVGGSHAGSAGHSADADREAPEGTALLLPSTSALLRPRGPQGGCGDRTGIDASS